MEDKAKVATEWNDKGNELSEAGEEEEAIECYDEAIALSPNFDSTWYNKGRSLSALGRDDEAIECYDEAIRINPEDAEYFYYKSISLGKMKMDEEARVFRNKALGLNPHIAALMEKKGRNEEGAGYSSGFLSDKPRVERTSNNNQSSLSYHRGANQSGSKYPAIEGLIGIFRGVATLCIVLMVLTGMIVFIMIISTSQYVGGAGVIGIIAIGLGIELLLGLCWLLTKAFSELFQVFIDIEENTRKK